MDEEYCRQLILKTLETSLEIQLKSIRLLLGKNDVPDQVIQIKGRRR